MAQFVKHFIQDLQQDIKIRQCGTIVFNADNLSNVISVDLYNGQEPYSGGGTVAGAVICPDGATVALDNGTLTGNVASVTLKADCFAIPGQIGVGVQVISGSIRTTVLKAIYNVELLSTDNIVDPDSRITASVTQLVADIEAATAEIPASDMASLMSGIAPTFSDSTNYAAGAYVYYNGTLYRFTADHAAGSWTGTDATAVALCNDLTNQANDLKSAIKLTSGSEILNNWTESAFYTLSSSATSVDISAPKTTGAGQFHCLYVACNPGDIFYITASGTSAARPFAFLSSASGENNIVKRASSSEYACDNYKVVAPENSVYAVFNASKNFPSLIIKGEYLVNRVSSVEDKTDENESAIESVKNQISAIGTTTQVTGTGELIVPNVIRTEGVIISGEPSSIIVRNAQLFEAKLGNSGLNGVTLTNNNDGSFTLNGTATGGAWFNLNQSSRTGHDNLLSLHGSYTLTIEIMSGSATEMTYAFRDVVNSTTLSYTGIATTLKLTSIVDSDNVGIAIQALKNAVYDKFRFRVMVNKGIESYKWTNYKAPHTITETDNILSVVNEYIPCPYIIATPDTTTINVFAQTGGSGSESSDEINNATIYRNDNFICANHRGYHQGYPENTLWAFAQSKLHGFLWIENDVRFTRDGVGVLLHDESINRTARNADGTEISTTININSIDYSDVLQYDFGIYAGPYFAGTKIVTIEECIAFCKSVGLGILCEPKIIGGGTYCANLVKAYAMEDSVIWISFVPDVLQEVNAVLPNAKIGLLTTQDPASSYVDTAVSLKTTTNSVFLGFDYRKPITSIKQSMIQNGIGYGVYTLDMASELDTLDPYCFEVTSNTIVAGTVLAKNTLSEWM